MKDITSHLAGEVAKYLIFGSIMNMWITGDSNCKPRLVSAFSRIIFSLREKIEWLKSDHDGDIAEDQVRHLERNDSDSLWNHQATG